MLLTLMCALFLLHLLCVADAVPPISSKGNELVSRSEASMHCVHNSLQGLQQLAHTLYVYTCITSSKVSIQYGNLMAGTTLYIVYTCVFTHMCATTPAMKAARPACRLVGLEGSCLLHTTLL